MIQGQAPIPLSVLIVDDEKTSRELLATHISGAKGWKLNIDIATSGDEALQKLGAGRHDLVLLDYRMPGRDGLDILPQIRQLHPKSAVVMVTSAGSEHVAVTAMKKGAMDYMTRDDILSQDVGQLFRRVVELRYLVDQNMELRQLNQMKNEFIANVSHELRTPLTVIIGFAEALKGGSLGPVSEGQGKALDSIVSKSHDLLKTVNQILRIRESHEGREQLLLKPLELRALLSQHAAKASRDCSNKGLRLETALPTQEVWVNADKEKLGVVLDNLLSNAVKFSPQGGAMRLSLLLRDGQALICLQDQGAGVAPEMLPRLFERLGAADQGPTREHGGLGLGLPLSKQIVEQHSGRVWLESAGPGSGTTAFVALPLASKEGPGVALEVAARYEKKRLLIVEDNPDIIEVLQLFLTRLSQNIELAIAHSGLEALDSLKAQTPHLIILDVMMPGMNGFELIERLRKAPQTASLPILVLTGYVEAAERARKLGAQEVMLKPFNHKVFISKILDLLRVEAPRA